MNGNDVDELLRAARPQRPSWAGSTRGRAVLTRVLEEDLAPERTSRRRTVVAIVAVAAAATAALLFAPRLLPTFDPAGSIDAYVKSDVEFYAPWGHDGGAAEEVHRFKTVEEGVKTSDAVVVAKVVEVKPTRMIADLYMWALVLQPVEVLSGKLHDKARDRLTVEFTAGSVDPAEAIARMKKNLPKGLAIWFLKSKGDPPAAPYYVLSSSQGLYLQGKDHVVCPTALTKPGAMVADLEAKRHLSEVAEAIRAAS